MKRAINFFLQRTILICSIFFALTPLIWFWGRENVLINGIDTNFPLDPALWFLKRLSVWNNTLNAGQDFSSSTAGLFFHLVQVVPYLIGLSLQTVQKISLIFWFSAITLSSFFLGSILFPKQKLAQVVVVVLYSFNIYLFNSWENVKVANLSLLATIPLMIGIFELLRERKVSKPKAGLYLVAAGVLVSGSGINPAYLITFFFIFTTYVFFALFYKFSRLEVLCLIRNYLYCSLIVVLINLFWIIPTVFYIFSDVSSAHSIDRIGFNNWIDSLSENTSVLNIIRMQGAWDWYAVDWQTGAPLYIPYALNYFYRFEFIVFSFVVPILALLSYLARERKRSYLYLSFGTMLALGTFLGAGTHLPTGQIYRIISNNIPFFTLFRSPWYIFTPLVILAYSFLVGLLVNTTLEYFNEKKKSFHSLIIKFLVVLLVVGNLVYSYPLVTGKIFRPGRQDGFFIEFPPYVFDAKKWLDEKDSERGRIIVYPDDEIEQFSWGYRGIESLLQLFTNKEVLFSPLNAPDSPIAKMVKQFYLELKKDELDSALSLASKMGVSFIFNKMDQNTITLNLNDRIKEFAVERFEGWEFYKLPKEKTTPKIYTGTDIYLDHSKGNSEKVVGVLGPQKLLVNADDTVAQKIPNITKTGGRILLAKNSTLEDYLSFSNNPSILFNRLLRRDASKVEFIINSPVDDSYEPLLERFRLEDYGINLSGTVDVNVDGQKQTWKISKLSDSYLYFEPVWLPQGEHRVTIYLKPVNLIEGGDFEGGKISYKERGQGDYRVLGDQDNNYLSILNTTKLKLGASERDVAAYFNIDQFNPLHLYLIQFRYKQVYGSNGSAIVSQTIDGKLAKIQTEALPNYPEWNNFSFYYEPVKTKSELWVYLLSPFIEDPLGTKMLYDNLEVNRVFTNKLVFFRHGISSNLSSGNVSYKMVSPTLYEVEINNAQEPHMLVFLENYSPKWKINLKDKEGKPLKVNPSHMTVNFYGNGWYIDSSGVDNYKATIYYQPQNLFLLGGIISAATLLTIISIFLWRRRYDRGQ